jgi:predicted ester cyclase
VYDGPDEVREYFRRSRLPFPDQRNEVIALHHADHAVISEFWLMGTHLGPLGDVAPTGHTFRVRMCAVFEFDDEGLVCERVYFNPGDILGPALAGGLTRGGNRADTVARPAVDGLPWS